MNTQDIRSKVMETIAEGKISMRPRWHFVLLSALSALGILILILALIYTISLVLFFLRESGALFLPGFGGRGWLDFFRSLPLSILGLVLVFVLMLEALVRRYAFVYKKPLLMSVIGIVALIVLGGFVLAQTPLHGQLVLLERHGNLPAPIDGLYRPPFKMHPDDVYRGTIVALVTGGFVMAGEGATTTVHVSARTLMPPGTDLSVGDPVVVLGDEEGNDIAAFGLTELEHEPWE